MTDTVANLLVFRHALVDDLAHREGQVGTDLLRQPKEGLVRDLRDEGEAELGVLRHGLPHEHILEANSDSHLVSNVIACCCAKRAQKLRQELRLV